MPEKGKPGKSGLFRLMILEEFRLNTSMIGKAQFIMFPAFIGVFSFLICAMLTVILKSMDMARLYLMFHGVMMVYGLGIGGFSLFGESIAERRFGQVNTLLSSPIIHPISFRKIFLYFYLKDLIYYLLFSIIPLFAGIILSMPLTHFRLQGIMFLLLTSSLSFMLGMSLSFFISTAYVRSKAALAAILAGLLGLFGVGWYLLRLYPLRALLPTLQYQYTANPQYLGISVALILVFSFLAVWFIKFEFGRRAERFEPAMAREEKRFSFAGKMSKFLAKEWMDINRSRTLSPIMFAYVGPLIFLMVIQWFLGTVLSLPVSFNVIFYAGLLGFFSITIYSWLNITDTPDFYELLPVTVPELVREKLVMLSFFTYPISCSFLALLSIITGQAALLPLALLAGVCTTAYTVLATAYLTGLRTNSYLFNPSVLAKFAGLIVPPLIIMLIASFMLGAFPIASMFIICACSGICGIASIILYRKIPSKWKSAAFTYAR